MKTIIVGLLFILVAGLSSAAELPIAKPVAPSKTPAKKPVYELPKTGLNQPRSAGGWINVEAVGTRLVIKFFDKEKKPMSPDLERGFVRLKYASKNPAQAVLTRDGNTLTTPATLRPPHNFLAILSLSATEATEPGESYTIKYP